MRQKGRPNSSFMSSITQNTYTSSTSDTTESAASTLPTSARPTHFDIRVYLQSVDVATASVTRDATRMYGATRLVAL